MRNRGIRSKLSAIAITLVGASGIFYLGSILPIQKSVIAQVHAQPFYLERTIFTADSKGSLTVSRREILARRSDGTTVRMQSVGPVESAQFLRKVVFADGSSTTFVDAINGKITWPHMTEAETSTLRGRLGTARSDCGVSLPYTLLAYDKMNDQEVAVIQRTVAGKYRLTRWLAPQLGCEDLYYKSEKINADGTYSLSAETRTSRFTVGEPDSHLFNWNENYIELKPSEAQHRLQQALKFNLPPEQAEQAEREGQLADQIYQRDKKR